MLSFGFLLENLPHNGVWDIKGKVQVEVGWIQLAEIK